jgi:hypothetical protein
MRTDNERLCANRPFNVRRCARQAHANVSSGQALGGGGSNWRSLADSSLVAANKGFATTPALVRARPAIGMAAAVQPWQCCSPSKVGAAGLSEVPPWRSPETSTLCTAAPVCTKQVECAYPPITNRQTHTAAIQRRTAPPNTKPDKCCCIFIARSG